MSDTIAATHVAALSERVEPIEKQLALSKS
jgi:hypothetical protein